MLQPSVERIWQIQVDVFPPFKWRIVSLGRWYLWVCNNSVRATQINYKGFLGGKRALGETGNGSETCMVKSYTGWGEGWGGSAPRQGFPGAKPPIRLARPVSSIRIRPVSIFRTEMHRSSFFDQKIRIDACSSSTTSPDMEMSRVATAASLMGVIDTLIRSKYDMRWSQETVRQADLCTTAVRSSSLHWVRQDPISERRLGVTPRSR